MSQVTKIRESQTGDLHCNLCGAALPAVATSCWLCHTPVGTHASELDGTAKAVGSARFAATPEALGGFSLASLMMFVTLVCVVLGVSTLWPGVGIPLGLLLLVVWLRTAAVTRRRAGRGLALTAVEQVQLFASSFGVTAALLGLVGVAGFSAFWAACFACMGTYFGLEGVFGENFAVTLAWIVCIAVALAFAFVAIRYLLPYIVRLIRRRWRRDVGEPK